MWRQYARTEATGVRASEALGIDYPWVASDLDNAVSLFGSWVNGQMMKAESAVQRRRKGKASADEIMGERQKALDIAITGERRRARRAQTHAEVQRGLSILARL